MEAIVKIIEDIPSWAKVVSVFIVLVFGVGGISNVTTKIISRKKVASEVGLDLAEASIKNATVEKTMTEVARDLMNEYKDLVESERLQKEKLEKRMDNLECSFEEFKKQSKRTIENLQRALHTAETKLENSEREVRLLRTYLSVVKLKWASMTDEPFPDYEKPYIELD